MADTVDRQTPEIAQLWREWLTQSERQVNAFFSEALSQDVSARGVAGFMEMYAGMQRLLAESMQRYLAFINVPSRSDVVGLGEALRSIEERLARIEETLQIAAEAVDARERSAPPFEPARTKRPPGFPPDTERPEVPAFNGGRRDASSVPDELRR